jgi:4-amino-4-deoxy-L-arabinose transferase-like glycosyltransferase
LVGGLVAVGRAPRTDLRRGALILWGGWLLVTGLVFSYMAGIFHAYYTVALAPAIAALVGIGGWLLWQRRGRIWARLVLGLTLAVTASWAFVLLGRSADFTPWLRYLVLFGGLIAAACLLIVDRIGRAVVSAVLAVGLLVGLGGSAAYAAQTVTTPHTGSIPSAGPTVLGTGFGGPGGARNMPFPGGLAGGRFPGGTFPGGPLPGGVTPNLPGGAGTTNRGPGAGAPMGGLLDAGDVTSDLTALLTEGASSYTWVAATVGANNAAGYQLATELPVMPLGGFNGSDPSPTLAQFQQYVADGQIHLFIGAGVGRSDSGSNAAQEIAAWVSANFHGQTIDGVMVYDLTQPLS